MFLSLSWLKKHINIPGKISPEKIGSLLISHTAEVEEMKNPADFFEKIVVGQVKEVQKHPDADRLVVAKVWDGKEELTVVCGGSNVKEGMTVALAKIGAKVRWHGEGDLIEMQEAEIRGVKSFGMICSPREIGLERHFECSEKEILDLSEYNLKAGDNLGFALGLNDSIYEIENKNITNRPDLWSHRGFARELAALTGGKMTAEKIKTPTVNSKEKITVEIKDKKACPRYMAVQVDNIKIKASPLWLKTALLKTGTRSINNIVDLTNFIMFDLGQPLHAFDAQKINNGQIIVRKAQENEKITLLDEQTLTLSENDLLICDAQKPIALAGIMGGNNSEIDAETVSLILEAANFDAQTIRKTSLRFGLRTEASVRYEKGQDPNLCEEAIFKFLNLLQEVCPEATVSTKITDVQNFSNEKNLVKLDLEYANRKAGIVFTKNSVEKTLKPLGFTVSGTGKKLNVTVPSWRSQGDVSMQDDLIEELTRIYGFDNITPVLPEVQIKKPEPNEWLVLERQIKDYLAFGTGMNEALNYSFLGESQIQNPTDYLALKNPLNKEESFLRQSLVPGLKKNTSDNFRFFEKFRLFEVGSVYFKEPGEMPADKTGQTKIPRQGKRAAGVVAGEEKEIFLTAKGIVEGLFEHLGFELKEGLVEYTTDTKLEKPAVFFEINLTELLKQPRKSKIFSELPKFPGITRDLALVVDRQTSFQDIFKAISGISPLLVRANLFDIFEGGQIGATKKSLAFHLEFRDQDRTLTAPEADGIVAKLVLELEQKFNAQIRK